MTVAHKDEQAKQLDKPKEDKRSSSVKPKTGRKNFIRRYFEETFGELRKVSWPTRKEAVNLTIVVIIVMFSMSGLLGILDFIYSKVLAFLFA
jgi:preprotein translocase subunit SecE